MNNCFRRPATLHGISHRLFTVEDGDDDRCLVFKILLTEVGLAVMVLQSCEVADNRRNLLCGNWESVEGKPDVLIYKEGEAYKVTVFKRSGLRRKLKPETYLLQEENGNLFMNTGFRIDVSYNEATDILTFSPNGDYIRVRPQPEHPINEQ